MVSETNRDHDMLTDTKLRNLKPQEKWSSQGFVDTVFNVV